MKLDSRTLQILKNFAMINPSMLFREGNVQTTIAPQKSMLARATITEEMPSEFAIYELSRFIGVMSLFDDPELEFSDKRVNITQGKQQVGYTFADPELIVLPPKSSPKVVDPEVVFDLPSENLNATMRALGVLQATHVVIEGDSETIYVGAGKPTDKTSDTFKIEVGSTEHTFKFAFKAEHIKVLPGNYTVQISSKNISHFKGDDIEYWIMADAVHSTFGGE